MRTRTFLAASLGVFALLGVVTTMLGPLLPLFALKWKLTDMQSGLLFVGQFSGGFLGAIVSTELIRIISVNRTIRAGLLLMAIGVVCVPSGSVWMLAGGITLYGTGIGLATPSISVAVCEVLSSNRARALNLLNFFWALGAILSPRVISRFAVEGRIGLRGTLFLISGMLVFSAFLIPSVTVTTARISRAVSFTASDLRLIVTTGVLLFAYVGLENSVAGWLPTFVQRVQTFSPGAGVLLLQIFWTVLLVSRLLAAIWVQQEREYLVLTSAISTLLAATAVLLFCHNVSLLYISVLLVGAGCAPIFPTAIAILSRKLSEESREKLGWMFAAGGLGGAVIPFCIGTLSSASTSLRKGMSLLLLIEIGMLLLSVILRKLCFSARELPLRSESARIMVEEP